jgi:hypothetical protein
MTPSRFTIACLLASSCLLPAQAPVAPAAAASACTREAALELAWQAALSVPLNPHTKDRARLQQQVVRGWLALDLPQRAAGLARQILDWRRGEALAEIAVHCIDAGDRETAGALVVEAIAVADERERIAEEQAWRVQRIRAKAAAALARLGRDEESLRLAQKVGATEWGPLSAIEAAHLDAARFDDAMAAIAAAEAKGLDAARNAMRLAIGLLDRFAADEPRCARLVAVLADGFPKAPPPVRVEMMLDAQAVACRHGRTAEAARLCTAARALLDGQRWIAEDLVRSRAALAIAWHRGGDVPAATVALDAAFAAYTAAEADILDLYRAAALRAIAEARQRTGDATGARLVYLQAVEAGLLNVNTRPRTEDLCETLVSMARHDVLPDAPLWQRLQRLAEELRGAW